MKLFQIIIGLGLAWSITAKTTRKSKQKDFAFKMYKAQAMESYNQHRNMVLSPASTYRMLHALCVASKDKTQKELRSLVSCKPRDTKKISANIRKIGKKRIRGIPQLYSSLGRLDLQTGLRILTSYASSSEILGLNLRVENKNFDMDWIGALDRINKFFNIEAERMKIADMPNMVPDENVVSATSRIVSSDQSIARIPIFSDNVSIRDFFTDQSTRISNYYGARSKIEPCNMITLENIEVEQLIDLNNHVISIRVSLPIRDLSMIILIPDGMNLAEFEEEMTQQMFQKYFDVNFKPDGDENLLFKENIVNLTMPLFEETHVNHHLDKSLLQRYGVKQLRTRSAELWAMSATPTAHLSSMLQRTHFELVQENPSMLSDHKKHERRRRSKRNKKHKRNTRPILIKKLGKKEELMDLKKTEELEKMAKKAKTDKKTGTESLSLIDQAEFELLLNRPFMFALVCYGDILQIGRFSTPKQIDNLDISDRWRNY